MRKGWRAEGRKSGRRGGLRHAGPAGISFFLNTPSSSIWASLDRETRVSSLLCNSVKPAQTSVEENLQKHLYSRWSSKRSSIGESVFEGTGGRFSVLVGSLGEMKVNSKKLAVLKVWTWGHGLECWVRGLMFMGQRTCFVCRDQDSRLCSHPTQQAPGRQKR